MKSKGAKAFQKSYAERCQRHLLKIFFLSLQGIRRARIRRSFQSSEPWLADASKIRLTRGTLRRRCFYTNDSGGIEVAVQSAVFNQAGMGSGFDFELGEVMISRIFRLISLLNQHIRLANCHLFRASKGSFKKWPLQPLKAVFIGSQNHAYVSSKTCGCFGQLMLMFSGKHKHVFFGSSAWGEKGVVMEKKLADCKVNFLPDNLARDSARIPQKHGSSGMSLTNTIFPVPCSFSYSGN